MRALPEGTTVHQHLGYCCVCERTNANEHAHLLDIADGLPVMLTVHPGCADDPFIDYVLAQGFTWVRLTADESECALPHHSGTPT